VGAVTAPRSESNNDTSFFRGLRETSSNESNQTRDLQPRQQRKLEKPQEEEL
jgi:hypothetical protein